ncbi:hypothetical protein CPB84DRAFT_1775419 [Gymnopilus junonius]|uniref:Uncharacterized protein n=1 Tax=Gymnopilus junonius TaxID=109634 RepID=A0A9P5TN89_GYMJU|nr:hypothetical protein CPB84DRAFT_1775419 [Gymnopilus junonius]
MQVIMIYRISKACCLLVIRFVSLTENSPISPNPTPGVTLCQERSFPQWLYVIWFPIASFEILLLVLSLSPALKYHKGIRAARLSGINSYLTSWGDPRSLAYVLLRDSVTFPCISLTICVANLIIWICLPHIAAQMAFCIAAFIPCIIGSRLILNLREVYYQPFTEECTTGDCWQPEELGM